MTEDIQKLKEKMRIWVQEGSEPEVVGQLVIDIIESGEYDNMPEEDFISILRFSMEEVKQCADVVISDLRAIINKS